MISVFFFGVGRKVDSQGAETGSMVSGAALKPFLALKVISHYMLAKLSDLATRYFTYQRGKPACTRAPPSPNTLIGSFTTNLLPQNTVKVLIKQMPFQISAGAL